MLTAELLKACISRQKGVDLSKIWNFIKRHWLKVLTVALVEAPHAGVQAVSWVRVGEQ
jgi:hypothetical protein